MKTTICLVALLLACAGCDTTAGDLARNTAQATARSWCSGASNCGTGVSRDPLADRAPWDRASGTNAKDPFPRHNR